MLLFIGRKSPFDHTSILRFPLQRAGSQYVENRRAENCIKLRRGVYCERIRQYRSGRIRVGHTHVPNLRTNCPVIARGHQQDNGRGVDHLRSDDLLREPKSTFKGHHGSVLESITGDRNQQVGICLHGVRVDILDEEL